MSNHKPYRTPEGRLFPRFPVKYKVDPASLTPGTIVKMNWIVAHGDLPIEQRKNFTQTVKRVECREPGDYLVVMEELSDYWVKQGDFTMHARYDISHITAIVKQAPGQVEMLPFFDQDYEVEAYDEMRQRYITEGIEAMRAKGFTPPSLKTHLVYYVSRKMFDMDADAVLRMWLGELQKPDTFYNYMTLLDAMTRAGVVQQFIPQDHVSDWVIAAPKKRARRWLRQNANRYLVRHKHVRAMRSAQDDIDFSTMQD